jgi:hypothetical protein
MSDYKEMKADALALLQDATNIIYAIPGDQWQMAYEVLEAVIANLRYAPPNEGKTA